jgi:hypothetical protein
VKQHVAVLIAEFGDRPPGGLGPGDTARDDPLELAVAAGRELARHLMGVRGCHHHQDGVHAGCPFERRHRVLEHRPPSQRQQLFGHAGAEPLT